MKVLIVGFGPFGDVVDNPSARIARALDGQIRSGVSFIGAEMPVSYLRSITHTQSLVDQHAPDWILGIGVASRDQPAFERFGTGRCGEQPDVDGCLRSVTSDRRTSSLPIDALATQLDWDLSDDAGDYVCNGWLHQALVRFSSLRVGFLHVPPAGVSPEALLDAFVVTAHPEVG